MKYVPKFGRKFQTRKKARHGELFNNLKLKTGSQVLLKDLYGREEGGETTSNDYLILVKPKLSTEEVKEIPRKASKEGFIYDGSFHEAVASVLLVAEFFSLMPVKGVSSKHPSQLSFSWSNLRTWYSLVCIGLLFINVAFRINQMFNSSIDLNTFVFVVFPSSCLALSVATLNLARKWPGLMMAWYETESELPAYQRQTDKRGVSYKIRMVAITLLFFSLVEELCFLLMTFVYARDHPQSGDLSKDFFFILMGYIFNVLPYSKWIAWTGLIEDFISSFVWTYADVFLVITSIGLSSNFKRINDNLLMYIDMEMPEAFWAERRIQYRKLCILCEQIDNAISVITFISFAKNIFFICVQLFGSIKRKPTVTDAVYFYFSLFLVIVRTIAVTLNASYVHEESRKPLSILRCVRKESWCLETKRFATEISNDFVALSGVKFFHVTRTLILSVAGAIFTYELVLIQFNGDDETQIYDQ